MGRVPLARVNEGYVMAGTRRALEALAGLIAATRRRARPAALMLNNDESHFLRPDEPTPLRHDRRLLACSW